MRNVFAELLIKENSEVDLEAAREILSPVLREKEDEELEAIVWSAVMATNVPVEFIVKHFLYISTVEIFRNYQEAVPGEVIIEHAKWVAWSIIDAMHHTAFDHFAGFLNLGYDASVKEAVIKEVFDMLVHSDSIEDEVLDEIAASFFPAATYVTKEFAMANIGAGKFDPFIVYMAREDISLEEMKEYIPYITQNTVCNTLMQINADIDQANMVIQPNGKLDFPENENMYRLRDRANRLLVMLTDDQIMKDFDRRTKQIEENIDAMKSLIVTE